MALRRDCRARFCPPRPRHPNPVREWVCRGAGLYQRSLARAQPGVGLDPNDDLASFAVQL